MSAILPIFSSKRRHFFLHFLFFFFPFFASAAYKKASDIELTTLNERGIRASIPSKLLPPRKALTRNKGDGVIAPGFSWVTFFYAVFCPLLPYERMQVYIKTGYEKGVLKTMIQLVKDGFAKLCCRSLDDGDKEINKMRERGYPICWGTNLLALFLISFFFFSLVRNTRPPIEQYFGEDFEFCRNPLLKNVTKEVENYPFWLSLNISRGERQVLLEQNYSYVLDKIALDFSPFSEIVPNSSLVRYLQNIVRDYSRALERADNLSKNAYPNFWPEKANQDFLETINVNTSNETSIIRKVIVGIPELLRFTRDVLPLRYTQREYCVYYVAGGGPPTVMEKMHLVGIVGALSDTFSYCSLFSTPYRQEFINTKVTLRDILNTNEIENNFYKSVVTTRFSNLQLSNVPINATNTTELTDLANQIARENEERAKRAIFDLVNRIKLANDFFPLVASVAVYFNIGYWIIRMTCKLRVLTTLSCLGRTQFILLGLFLITLFDFLVIPFREIFFYLQNLDLFLNFSLRLGTKFCHVKSKEEFFLNLALSDITARLLATQKQVSDLEVFYLQRREAEESYRNISGLVYHGYFQNLWENHTFFSGLLNGSSFIDDFPLLNGALRCDKNLSDLLLFYNTTDQIPCATPFDIDFMPQIIERVHEAFTISLEGLGPDILIYAFMGSSVTIFLSSIFGLIEPLAAYRGRMIGTQAVKGVVDPLPIKKSKPIDDRGGNRWKCFSCRPFKIRTTPEERERFHRNWHPLSDPGAYMMGENVEKNEEYMKKYKEYMKKYKKEMEQDKKDFFAQRKEESVENFIRCTSLLPFFCSTGLVIYGLANRLI